MIPFKLHRICTIMEPEKGNELEVEGVLNPAVARGPDGHLYIFPRLVAKNNYSRIGIAKVNFNDAGDPENVKRLGIVLRSEERRVGKESRYRGERTEGETRKEEPQL